MKNLLYSIREEKENNCEAQVKIQGDFDQSELTALVKVVLMHARTNQMCIEEIIEQALGTEEIINILDAVISKYTDFSSEPDMQTRNRIMN